MEGHVQGSRSKALRQQLNCLPVTLHPWTGRRTDGGQRLTGQRVTRAGRVRTDGLEGCAELKGAHGARRVLVKLEENGLGRDDMLE